MDYGTSAHRRCGYTCREEHRYVRGRKGCWLFVSLACCADVLTCLVLFSSSLVFFPSFSDDWYAP